MLDLSAVVLLQPLSASLGPYMHRYAPTHTPFPPPCACQAARDSAAAQAFTTLRRGVARAKQRASAQQLGIPLPMPARRVGRSGAGAGGSGRGAGSSNSVLQAILGPIMALPWWALLLIVLHLAYRMVKVRAYL